jgi:formyltetrahydrofolate deformylase
MAVHILTLACPDRPGIVASIAQGLFDLGANIVENAQFSDAATSTFCMRTRFESPIGDAAPILAALRPRAEALSATIDVHGVERRTRTLVMVSRYDHCLVDLLYRVHAGEIPIEVPVVVSNHPDLAATVARHGIPFVHVPVTPDARAEADARLVALV